MNIIENKPETEFLVIQLIVLGTLNLISFKKFDTLNDKVGKLVEESKKVKI
ncbi:hypothetical protein [Salinicoccus halodurans]|uniref:Uncharacterized protein n=1 Tax=Salinicoccus halodurans TaxID=407035 RepID=A0AA94KXI4_9STAP|nr:hypothetical protein [Salinicoccus halodurans]SFK93752.1 hypothetical protein SAMN05216235_2594 [Salinicoccus halodurans]